MLCPPRWILVAGGSLAVLAVAAIPSAGAASSGQVMGVPGSSDDAPRDNALADPMPVLSATLAEAQAQLAGQPDPAHHLAYAIVETSTLTVQGTHGAHAGTLRSFDRTLDVDLRVGTPTLDSTHKIRDAGFFSEDRRPAWTVVFEGPASALRLALLRATDDVFRIQRARLTKVRANESVKVAREDESADWSAAPPLTRAVEVLPPAVDVAAWQEIVADVSAIYLSFPEVYDSAVQLTVTTTRRWLVSADGSTGPANIVVADGDNHLRIATWGETVADDGMDLSVYDYTDVARADHLPSRPQIDAMARGVAERVTALRHAPTVDPWSGPAILRGRAAGVFFHEIFGHRIEGQRQKDEDEGQTFTKKVNEPVLPAFLSVIDDPTQATRAGEDLNGHYAVDDEGVAAERVTLVDKGVLKGFLMSRSPIEGFSRSNGHGRRQPGNAVVARQGNLMVDAATSVPYPELRRQLVDLAKKQKRTFGLVFDDISGGFTFTGRSTPNSFVVEPVTVWKVYTDGRPDELVRGVDLIGTPLTTFARIVAAADDVAVFNGVCGAESGWVPVSASAPSLLVSEVEVQRREKGNDRPPILPPIVGAGK